MTASHEEDPSVTSDSCTRGIRKDAARNRESLIQAGREVFAQRGLDASLDEIAHRAGVGVGTAYRHFANKFELAEAIMTTTLGEVCTLARDAAQMPNSWNGLVAFLEGVLALLAKDRGLREVMTGVTDPQHDQHAHEQLTELVAALFHRAQNDGEVRADAVTSDLGCLVIMLCQVADLGPDDAPDLWRRYLPTLLSALRPDGPPLPGAPLTDQQLHTATQKAKHRNWTSEWPQPGHSPQSTPTQPRSGTRLAHGP